MKKNGSSLIMARLCNAMLLILSLSTIEAIAAPLPPTISPTINGLSQNVWLTERWTAKEQPFISARKNIETTVRAKHNVALLAAKYAALAQKYPTNSLYMFRWGLATYYVAQNENITWKPPIVERLLSRLSTFPSPHSAQFARMRFLIETRYIGTPRLKTVGLRLLQRDPHDDAVKASMYPVLNVIGSPADGMLAVKLANELIAENPRYPKWHAMLGAAYYDISIRQNTRSNCLKSIAAYQKYLELAKPSDPFREQAERLIKELQKTMPK